MKMMWQRVRIETSGYIMIASWLLCYLFLLMRKPWANEVALFFKVSGWVSVAVIVAIKTFSEVIK